MQQYHLDGPSPVQPSSRSLGVNPAHANAPEPRQYFKHYLDANTPRGVSNHSTGLSENQSTPISYAAQQASAYQDKISQSEWQPQPQPQTYNAPTIIAQGQSFAGPNQSTSQSIGQNPSAAELGFQPEFEQTATSFSSSLDKALKQSPRLAIEDIRIQEAEEQLEQAKSQGRLKLNFEGAVGASQNETDFRIVDRTDSDFRAPRTASLNLSIPLYQGGRINAQEDAAQVGIETAKANYQAVETNVTEQAGIAHLDVLRDRALVEVYHRNVTLLENQKSTVQALLRAGENTITDEALVDARLASIQARLAQARSNQSASESRYKKLTGYPAPALFPLEGIRLPNSLQDVKEAAFGNNAELQAMQSQSEAAQHNIAIAKSFSRPTLALQGALRTAEGFSDTIRSNSAAELLLNLNVPLLSGGENKSRVRQAVLEQSRSVLETRDLQDNLNERIEQLWASVNAAKQSQAPNLAQKRAAEAAYQAILLQRQSGVATSLDVLSVEQTLLDSELNIIQANNAEAVARLRILGLMGAL